MKSIRVQIRWPNGTQLPVRIPCSSYLSDLESLLRFSIHQNRIMVLIYKGRRLDDSMTLEDQGIVEDSIIQVAHIMKNSSNAEGNELFNEILRIADLQFNLVEGHKSGGLILDSMMHETKNKEDVDEIEDITIFGSVAECKSAKIRSDPLPILWDDEMSSEIKVYLESLPNFDERKKA